MKHYDDTQAHTAPDHPDFTLPPDPLAASRLNRPGVADPEGLDLTGLLHGLRATLARGNMPEVETMMAAQMHILNAAFNRLVMTGTKPQSTDAYCIDVAIRVQRRCLSTCEALEIRMARLFDKQILGKQTDKKFLPGPGEKA